jgi:hypothetical protein
MDGIGEHLGSKIKTGKIIPFYHPDDGHADSQAGQHGLVDLFRPGVSLVDQVKDLTSQGPLQPVDDESRDELFDEHRCLADRCQKGLHAGRYSRIRVGPVDDSLPME